MFRGNINSRSAPTAGAAGLIAAGTAALSERLGSTAGSSTGDVDCRLTKRRNILAAGYFRTGISQHFGIAVCVGHIAARHTGCKNRAVAAGKDHLRGHIVAAAAVHAETAERIAAVEDNRTVGIEAVSILERVLRYNVNRQKVEKQGRNPYILPKKRQKGYLLLKPAPKIFFDGLEVPDQYSSGGIYRRLVFSSV